jgi:site-specific DNA recombinase
MESAWSNAKPAYRRRHGYTSATTPDPGRVKNAYVHEDRLLLRLPALYLLLTSGNPAVRRRRRTRRGVDVPQVSAEDVIGYLRKKQVTVTWDQAAGTLRAGAVGAVKTTTGKAN